MDDIFASDDTKELKHSDSHAQSRRTAHVVADKPFGYKTSAAVPGSATNKTATIRYSPKAPAFNVYAQSAPVAPQPPPPRPSHADYSNQHFEQRGTPHSHVQSNPEASSNYDRVLLTPQ